MLFFAIPVYVCAGQRVHAYFLLTLPIPIFMHRDVYLYVLVFYALATTAAVEWQETNYYDFYFYLVFVFFIADNNNIICVVRDT